VVTSVVLPFLKILPFVVLKWTAPVQTSYWERTVGLIMFDWLKGEPVLVDEGDVLATLVVDVCEIVVFVGAAAESERRAAKAEMARNFMVKV
jgi:hypothetical protein